MDDLDSCGFERVARADSGELEQMWRPDRAGAEDDLARAVGLVFGLVALGAQGDADGASVLEQDAGDERIGDDA